MPEAVVMYVARHRADKGDRNQIAGYWLRAGHDEAFWAWLDYYTPKHRA